MARPNYMLVTALLVAGQPDVLAQNCEMCGLLVHHLEVILHDSGWQPPQASGRQGGGLKLFSKGSREPASKGSDDPPQHLTRKDVDAVVVEKIELFLAKACTTSVSRIRLCSANGDDSSRIRNPIGVRFDNEGCRVRLQERCEHVVPAYAAPMLDAVINNRSATACIDMFPGNACDTKRATLLLGPLYGTEEHNFARFAPILDAGVKDMWRRFPGNPPYYHNAARHLTQEDPPDGWDPSGPNEQVLPYPAAQPDKEEL